MRGSLRRRLLLLTFGILGLNAPALAQQTLVTRVIDGDTIVVSGVGTVRLIGVDTPETVDPRRPVQYFGAEASAFTTKLAQGKAVRLEFEGATKDKYNRTLAYVYLADGTLLNAEIIRLGYGHAYTQFPFSKMEEFRRLQREAAQGGRGLWASGVENASSELRQPSAAVAAAQSGSVGAATETVYATRTGSKYHRAGCRYLARSQIPMSLKEAAARYGACSVCRPPVLASVPATGAATASTVTAAIRFDPPSSNASTPVLITRTGQKYHRSGCRTLRNGSIPSTLGEASKRYEPCAVCRPPVLGATTPASSAASPPAPPRPAATSGRCQATTKKGTQCSRNAQGGQ